MLRTHPRERRFLAGRALGTYFVFCTVFFGVVTGPLVWCRVAASMMRITQAALGIDTSRIPCFMDDFLFVVAGSRPERISKAWQALLLWRALGARIAWRKGNYGNSVQWIGGQLALRVTPGPRSTEQRDQGSPSPERFAIRVSLPVQKMQALLVELRSINKCPKGMVYQDRLRSLAGLGSWIAGFAPQVKPFIKQIYAAIAAPVQGSSNPLAVHKFGGAPRVLLLNLCTASRLLLLCTGSSCLL